jgi:hypothetical protein
MSGTSTLTTVLEGYLRDLRALIDAAGAQIDAGSAHSGLLAKTCLETARLVAYERLFLLPTLSAVPDGAELVRLENERLDALLDAARVVERVPTADESALEPLRRLAEAVDGLASHQRDHTLPRIERETPDDVLVDLGARVAGTQEPGTTHSHPAAIARLDGTGWPSSGYTDAAYEAFVDEVRTREPGLAPQP